MDNFYIILVEPAFSGNIGSVARAIKNMGINKLRLVKPCNHKSDEAVKFAVNATDILDNAEIFPDFYSAVKDLNITVATSVKKGKYRKPVFTVSDIVPVLKSFSEKNKIGIVFGRERIGLLNEEIDQCSLIAEIPSSDDYPCLNLSQSVLIFAYELFKDIRFIQEPNIYNVVSVENMEKFYEKFQDLLLDINFLDKDNPEFKMKAIRKIFGRCYLTKNELNLLYGIIRQVRNMESILKKKTESKVEK